MPTRRRVILMFVLLFLPGLVLPARSQAPAAQLTVLGKDGAPLTQLVDGNTLRLQLTLPENARQDIPVTFRLAGSDGQVAGCSIAQGQAGCESQPFASLGWYWEAGGVPQPSRSVEAWAGGQLLASSVPLRVSPRPVILVHGFISNWETWISYLGPDGFLATAGLHGYAVGDGQAPGTLNTGDITRPAGRTNTIAENAAILGNYIAQVKAQSGAQAVDLVVHSLGGMISRYYIDRLMPEGEVAQLIMLGSPMAGSDCANLPAALGFYMPATIEIQPSYMVNIFNPLITHRRGVPFYDLAGVELTRAIESPCTPVPSDIAVSRQSVAAIPLSVTELPVLHSQMTTLPEVFQGYVLPLLQTPAGSFQPQPDPPNPAQAPTPIQFTRVHSGHLNPGETRDLTINIEAGVSVASFALYDTSRSLRVTVKGASGKVIELDPGKNGLIQVDDPGTLVYLGYGFENPLPGAWVVTLQSTSSTPASGADYALSAVYQGGATLRAAVDTPLPRSGQSVNLTARLELGSQPLAGGQAQVTVIDADGNRQVLDMELAEDGLSHWLIWTPAAPGLYSLQVFVSATTADGFAIERTAYLAVAAQPSAALTTRSLIGLGLVALGLLAAFILFWRARRRRRRARSG